MAVKYLKCDPGTSGSRSNHNLKTIDSEKVDYESGWGRSMGSQASCDRAGGRDSSFRAVLTPQTLKGNRTAASPRPVLSPECALSDFFRFDALNGQIASRIFESSNGEIEEICETTSAVRQPKLENVFSPMGRDTTTVHQHQ
jgi:hypothetical protein